MLALVIDDSRAMRTILRSMLQDVGFETVEAANGRDALTVLDERPETKLILLDWNMPVMDGFEFLTCVRSNPERRSMRILMVTTETETEHVMKALSAGANEYLMKPFAKEALYAKLNMIDA